MLRYIYLLCFFLIYLELVFCYNSIHGKDMRSVRHRRRDIGKNHRSTTSSPLAHIDVINFMQKPEADDFEPYNFENQRRFNPDYQTLDAPAPRRRRARHELAVDGLHPKNIHRHLTRHLVHHPKRKCSFAFPFFSHKNKNKTKPASPKHERKSHSLRFSKSKEPLYNPVVADKREPKKMIQAIHLTEPTTMKGLSSNFKMKNSAKNHNSRLYFANPYRINNEGDGLYGI